MAAKISMFIKRNKLFFIALAIAIGTALAYAVVNAVLAHFDLQLAEYVLYAVYIICVLCILFMFLYCIVVCIKKVRQNKWNILGAFVAVCLLGAFLFLQLWPIGFGYNPVHIVKRKGQKFVAVVFVRLNKIDYYDYKNILVCGKQVKIQEHYTEGSGDPLAAENPSENLIYAHYYDDNGNLMSGYDDNGNLISSYRYDDNGNLMSGYHYEYDNNGNLISSYRYKYDDNGNWTPGYDENENLTSSYYYNDDGNLISGYDTGRHY